MSEIIIDGVDVSECKHYRAEIETKMPYGEYEILKDKCHYSGIEIIQDCKGIKECIYKQLQRAKTEIEELKKQVKNNETAYHTELGTYNMECGNLLEENKELIAENEKLKEQLNKKDDLINDITNGGIQLQKECERLKDKVYTLQGAFDFQVRSNGKINEFRIKYRTALKDIRDIAEKMYNTNDEDTERDLHIELQAKINEVIGAEE